VCGCRCGLVSGCGKTVVRVYRSGRISAKFDTGGLLWKFVEKLHMWLDLWKISGTLHEVLSALYYCLYCWQLNNTHRTHCCFSIPTLLKLTSVSIYKSTWPTIQENLYLQVGRIWLIMSLWQGLHKRMVRGGTSIRLVRYRTAKVTTLDSITHLDLSHTKCSLKVTTSQMLSMAYEQRKSAMCLVVRGTKPLCSECFQRKFRNEFRRKLPHVNDIHRWFEQFKGTGSVCKIISSERPAVTLAQI
jgi:hypothetical protein